MARLDRANSAHGFSKSAPRHGYRPSVNGNFVFTMPKVSVTALKLPYRERLEVLRNYFATKASAARALGVNEKTMARWRAWLQQMGKDRPGLAKNLLTKPLWGVKLGREYYSLGPNKLRLKYGLTNVGMRGLVLWLRMGDYIGESYYAYKENIDRQVISNAQYRSFGKRP